MTSVQEKPKRRPPAALFALGRADLPAEVGVQDGRWRFVKLFKHDFFAATGLYESLGTPGTLAVLKIQRTYPLFGIPMQWLGALVAGHEIRVYEKLQGIPGIPAFLGRVGPTGFLHAFVPGVDLHAKLPLGPEFFAELQALFAALHERHVAYVDSNKRENILYGDDGKPWLIDFQISFELKKGDGDNAPARWLFHKFARADWYHFYKHKTRLLPAACVPEDFARARKRGILHQFHRFIARPIIVARRRFLSRYDLANTR